MSPKQARLANVGTWTTHTHHILDQLTLPTTTAEIQMARTPPGVILPIPTPGGNTAKFPSANLHVSYTHQMVHLQNLNARFFYYVFLNTFWVYF